MKNIIYSLEINSIKLTLKKIPIFGGFDDEQLYKIFSILEDVRYKKGEYIFKQGDPPTHIYIILKGRVSFIKEGDNEDQKIYEFGEGRCIGEDSVIGIYPHTLTALAAEDVELGMISKRSLLEFFETDKDLFGHLILNISREISRRLKLTDNLLLHYMNEE